MSDPETTRSDKHVCVKPMLTDPDKQDTGNREPADETNKEDPTQGILVWLQLFTVNLEDLEAQCSHIPLEERSQIRKVMLQKWRHKKRKQSVHAYFRKNQQRSILRAEKYGDLTTAEPKVIHTDNLLEFGKSCEELSWNHGTATRHRSETSETAGRAVRRIKEVTSAVLFQSVLNGKWLSDYMECYCYLRGVPNLLANWNSQEEQRF